MARSLDTKDKITDRVVETINANANYEVTKDSNLNQFDTNGKRALYFPVRDAIEAAGCSTEGLSPNSFAGFSSVKDVIGAVAKANNVS